VVNFFPVKQQSSRTKWVNIPAVAGFVGGDVGVVEPALAPLDLAERVVNGGARGAERAARRLLTSVPFNSMPASSVSPMK